jgi:hypothetical protein
MVNNTNICKESDLFFENRVEGLPISGLGIRIGFELLYLYLTWQILNETTLHCHHTLYNTPQQIIINNLILKKIWIIRIFN